MSKNIQICTPILNLLKIIDTQEHICLPFKGSNDDMTIKILSKYKKNDKEYFIHLDFYVNSEGTTLFNYHRGPAMQSYETSITKSKTFRRGWIPKSFLAYAYPLIEDLWINDNTDDTDIPEYLMEFFSQFT